MNEVNIEFNSTYISSNLIDELDFILGEYGKPNVTFIYSLNAFIEAFVLNSNFYLTDKEFKHINLLSKSIFPSGRPILELLIKNKKVSIISGIGNNIGQVTGIIKTDFSNPISYQEKIDKFISEGLDTEVAREKYLKISSLNNDNINLKYLSIGKVEDGLIALESSDTPEQFYNSFLVATSNSNLQAALPFYSYDYQITNLKNKGISKEILGRISSAFNNKQENLYNYFGLSNQKIPALVNILLSQCKSISDIPQKLLQLDKDFTELRNSTINYETRLNDSKTIKEQLEAIDEYNKFWDVFNKKYNSSSRLLFNFWEASDNMEMEKALDKAIDDNDITNIVEDLNLGKLIGKSSKKIIDYYKEKKILKRFRGVTDIWNLYNSSPNIKDNIKNFEKVFDVKLDTNDLKSIQQKLK